MHAEVTASSLNFTPSSEVLAEAQKWKGRPEDIPLDDLPTEFDWSNFEDQDFVGGAKDQKGCGSCYQVANI
jgi:hypothetical protein